tara:strand:+ start:28501 stop:31347 length:2847 start_codon:yes stop_codon:yes gene_type:complete
MKSICFKILFLSTSFLFFTSCATDSKDDQTTVETTFKVDYEKFTLDNGLDVIFHIDRSDPVVAVALTSHVGSAREKEGRTGFAHLFEHLLFLESENLGKGGLDKMSARIGGSGANGSTSRDRTNYFQTVPKDALEKMIWAEADKLGYFINTVTDPVLAKEKQVVKNEKRQSVDNRPYGHTFYVIDKNLYPEGHPYNWQVIGSLEDLQNATLDDVKDFFNKWYVPNNVTLTIAGDFDTKQAKEWVKKYFDEIKKGDEIPEMKKAPSVLTSSKKLYHEDNFARLPELTLTWPGVPAYDKDSYALDILYQYLSEGKKAPLYKVLVEDKKLTANINMFGYNSEISGQSMLSVRAFEGVDLDSVQKSINEAFSLFEANGIDEKDLKRIKAGLETDFYNGLSSVLGKGFQLAQYNIYKKDPGFVNQDVKNILSVTTDDITRVYNSYIKNKNFVATSFVPKNQVELALTDSKKAEVVEEKIIAGAEETFDASIAASYEKTPSSFDRSVEPPYGNEITVNTPQIWKDSLENGMKLFGIENNEVPLVQFEMVLKGGLLLDDPEKVGVANMLAQLITKGTQHKTAEQLEEAIEQLGASISVRTTRESIVISGNSLARNYKETMKLVEEILIEPRWDEKEFELIKQSTISTIKQQQANPNNIASNAYNLLIYGKDHIFSHNILGSESSVSAISMADLKAYYTAYFSPTISNFHIVGAIGKNDVLTTLADINTKWAAKTVQFPEYSMPNAPAQSQVYFYDVPGAKQSVIRFGYPALAATDKDYYPATMMNFILGGGGFASQLTQQLREGKGYTYGIFSNFSGSTIPGPFTISSGVRTNVTYESASLVKEILENYGNNYSENDLATTKSFLIKSNARGLETLNSKLNILENISSFGWSDDYVKQQEEIVKNMTIDQIKALAEKYLDPNRMIYLVVGDAATQKDRLRKLDFGEPVLLNDTSK